MANELQLREEDYASLLIILRQVRDAVDCEIAICGSVAQRALLPDFAKEKAGMPLSDIDFALLGGTYDDCPVSPNIKNNFFITDINPSHGSYYFGMTHKKSKMWVDLFSVKYPQNLTTIVIDGKRFKAVSMESNSIYLARDFFCRIRAKMPLRQKWIDKLKWLTQQDILDWNAMEEEFANNRDYLLSDTASVHPPKSAKEFVALAIEEASAHVGEARRKTSFFAQYPTDSVVTTNGIRIENRLTFYLLKLKLL